MGGLKLIEVKDSSPDVNDLMYEVMLEGRQIGRAYLYRSADGEVTLDYLYEPTARQNHERLYTEERLEREGYMFMSWAQCDEGMHRQLEALRDEIEEEGRWLPTDFPKCDGDLTLIGLYKGEVCGWMIFERLSEDEADCRRWYAVEKFRRQSGGREIVGAFLSARARALSQVAVQREARPWSRHEILSAVFQGRD